jgi:prophage antirepressor-like protein
MTTENEITKVFQFNDQPVNVFVDPETDEILFDATNVCSVLGYARSASNVVEKLDDDEKRLVDRAKFDPTVSVGSAGAVKKWFLTEAGLYTLAVLSEKPQAKDFRRWVTHEVLPSIRKRGFYATEETAKKMVNDPDAYIRILKANIQAVELYKESERKRKLAEEKVAELEIKLDGHEDFWTVLRFVTETHFPYENKRELAAVGRKLVKRSREMCYDVRKAADDRYGKVNSYNVNVIKKEFPEFAKMVDEARL